MRRSRTTQLCYVLDQFDESTTFNKAKLFNSGILEAKKDKNWDCFVFHDVDLLLKNESVLYKCEENGNPLHLSVAIDKYNFRLLSKGDKTTIGGVSLFGSEAIDRTNGWSNRFWGWGGEDDNMYKRVVDAGLELARPEFKCRHPNEVTDWYARNQFAMGKRDNFNCGMWQMIPHGDDEGNPVNTHRHSLMDENDREMDGIRNVEYNVVEKIVRYDGLFNYLLIDIGGIGLSKFGESNQGNAVWKDKAKWQKENEKLEIQKMVEIQRKNSILFFRERQNLRAKHTGI